MTDAVLEPWAQVTPHDVQRLLSDLPIRWWIAGGWALDVEGRHPHRDMDVALLRPEHEVLRDYLDGWDLRIAYRGVLRPWTGGPVGPPENAVWARPTANHPWHIDFKIERVEGDEWVYRRDAAVRRPLAELGVVVDGIPYLAPDIARLYRDRPSDDDAFPQVGQDVYVGSTLYLTHGRDDFAGGLCRIVEIVPGGVYGPGLFVEVEEDPGSYHSWAYLMEHQEEWAAPYGDRRGHPDPDLRPEFNED